MKQKGWMLMFFYSDDPERDLDRYEMAREKELEKLPKCSECGEPITEENFYLINDEYICECCIDNYKVRTEDYVG